MHEWKSIENRCRACKLKRNYQVNICLNRKTSPEAKVKSQCLGAVRLTKITEIKQSAHNEPATVEYF